ncbi:monooxygenase [Priestia endophytica]
MPYLVQVDFKFDGPFGEDMTKGFTDIANSINEEPGFIWKIWTENKETKEAGGIYLFETKPDAEKYLEMHTKRLKGFGVEQVNGKIFNINEQLTSLNKGPFQSL